MSFASLLNHRMRVRRVSVADGALGGTTTTMPVVGDVRSRVTETVPIEEQERGAGEFPWGTRRVSCMPDVDVIERDILEIYEGPESPLNLRVISRANPGSFNGHGAHHIVLTVEPWNGELVPA